MDPKVEHYKVTFLNDRNSIGFKYYFSDRDLIDFLKKRPNRENVIKLEQYDRETHTFKPFD